MQISLVTNKNFELAITIIILLQAATLALETFKELESFKNIFEYVHLFVLAAFIVEAGLKITAFRPKGYFRDGWNVFDFAVLAVSLIPLTGSLATVFRLLRLLRVTRLTSRSKELRMIIGTLVCSIPSMLNIVVLLGMLFFIYGIAGYHLFGEIDHAHWGTLPDSFLTLFKIITLEGWVDIMNPILQENPLGGLYFISFIVIGTFIVINLFIAVIVRKSEEAYKHLQAEYSTTATQAEIMNEVREIRRMIEDLERKLGRNNN